MNRRWVADGVLAVVLLIVELIAAVPLAGPRPLDAFGAVLLTLATAVVVARRSWPLGVLFAHLALAIPYHANEFPHEAVVPATIVALYTVARYGTRVRTALVVAMVLLFGVGGILLSRTENENTALQAFGAVGWIVLACVAGEAVRLHRAYLAEALDRAERAERSRDAEARRQVAEERLRIARDLHDLLAHTITVIQVQAGVAAHLLTEGRADRATVVAALDTIADACADARAELAATVGVLRTPGGEPRGPLPALAQLSALAEPAEVAGVMVEFEIVGEARALLPTVEMVAYRIVQEALTNVAKHARATRALVRLDYEVDRLTVCVTDDGRGTFDGAPGFGIRGMVERAEAVGGSLRTLGTDAGFTVTAELPIPGAPEAAGAMDDSRRSVGDAHRGGAQVPTGDGGRSDGGDVGRGGMDARDVGVRVDGGSGVRGAGGSGVRGGDRSETSGVAS
ncbi:Signal transduction histidine kinase [Nocardia amikacinitolerans]|uniref:sensor histidine kinase n=1 Tax=Nocardia amikacinitolerans TaxID=756689 RepID=UPI0020A58E1E|nr:sensor histidine kinase [Nocardia amikacinitolerans]MCP2299767.1 Signal transduction histidine kinase [Nocardia amikacinitolerans]